jgi:TonB family protein
MRYWTISCLGALITAPAAGQDADSRVDTALETVSDSLRSYERAQPIERDPPNYPREMLAKGREAWVQVSYCIDEAGKPQNIVIVDSVGDRAFRRNAIHAVERWQFKPAMYDGEPAWQSRNDAVITFGFEDPETAARRSFVARYEELGELIDNEKWDEAEAMFRRTMDDEALSLYELSKLWAQRARMDLAQGNLDALHIALHRATISEGRWIEKDSYLGLLALRVRVELSLGNYASALMAFDDVVEISGEGAPVITELKPFIDKLNNAIDSDSALVTNATIQDGETCYACYDKVFYTLVRRDFGIADVAGKLDTIEIRCDHKRYEYEVSELVEWQIPESWGKCQIQITGEPGTTFKIVQYPAS